jgi:hypothetical protein
MLSGMWRHLINEERKWDSWLTWDDEVSVDNGGDGRAHRNASWNLQASRKAPNDTKRESCYSGEDHFLTQIEK